ncbi:hypothetical protein RND81_08G080300 [Saponaria officinalis]|uniref:Secreted protein n=1 Tax=Saponaria officinalis TaxID=3572 RepID=A0AAW1J4X9_SAPOF
MFMISCVAFVLMCSVFFLLYTPHYGQLNITQRKWSSTHKAITIRIKQPLQHVVRRVYSSNNTFCQQRYSAQYSVYAVQNNMKLTRYRYKAEQGDSDGKSHRRGGDKSDP